MKKNAAWIFLAITLASAVAGCGNRMPSSTSPNNSTDGTYVDMQKVYDLSVEAEAYTHKLFEAMLSEKGISQYEITLTSGGFITNDPLIFIAGYQYTYDETDDVYGYKLSLNEDGTSFTVLEEGVDVGEFVLR